LQNIPKHPEETVSLLESFQMQSNNTNYENVSYLCTQSIWRGTSLSGLWEYVLISGLVLPFRQKFPLMSRGGRAEGLACANSGARTPISVSENFICFPLTNHFKINHLFFNYDAPFQRQYSYQTCNALLACCNALVQSQMKLTLIVFFDLLI
jgi:hypothetical protein